MSDDRRRNEVLIGGIAEGELVMALEAAGLGLRQVPTHADAAEYVARELERGGTVPSVILLPGQEDGVVGSARKIRTAAPTSQLIFIADWRERSALQPALRAAGMNQGWSFALPEPSMLVPTVRDAIATSGQRRMVRTTLDRSDVHVASEELTAKRVRDMALSDALLGAILRDAVDAIIAVDERGRVASANGAAERLFGYEGGLQNLSIAQLMPGCADLADIVGLATSQQVVCNDGTTVRVEATVSRVFLGSAPAGYAIIARDIRARLAQEAELRRQAELTSTIVNGIAEGVYVIDAFGNLLFMNPAAEEMLGWSYDELARQNIHDTIHRTNVDGDHVTAGSCALLQAIRSGIPLRTDEVFTRRDGSLVTVACAVTPVRLGAEVIGGVFNFHDLTHMHEMQAQLRAEKESLAELNQAKDEFLATVSHELRTPLTAILGWLQLVSRGGIGDGELSEALEAIEMSARAQAKIVNDLLDVSRTISGKLHLAMTEVDLNDVVAAGVSTIRPAAAAKNLRLEVFSSPERVMICGDAGRLNQIVWNLATNAIKFTPDGGKVVIRVESRDGRARLIVADDGVGIAREMLTSIFDRYRQAETSVALGGLGLGLAIVRTLVERHGGTIGIDSDLGRGTTVTVELPLFHTECDASTA